MPELRRDPLTGRLVSYAPERAKRPLPAPEAAPPLLDDPAKCPFCPGKEDALAPATLILVRTGVGVRFEREEGAERKKNWVAKCIPNLYPAFSINDVLRDGSGSRNVSGIHEVLIETPTHDADPWRLSVDQLQFYLLTLRERLIQIESDPRMIYACFGKNHGPHSGGSLRHPHSHIFATPITPPLIEIESEKLHEGDCILCDIARESQNPRTIISTRSFLATCPWASREPFEIMMFPKRHERRFIDLDDDGILELATALSTIYKALDRVLKSPSFNLVLHTKPKDRGDFHWHLELVPRVLMPMVSEVGLNIYVNTVLPEEAAEKLRSTISLL
ncbi:MAG: hypothetical protein N3F65_00720 [Nitrososphaeria archaeon]|nr:hypothetical protein [Nitrososphaeria archaeon]MDW8021457.1 hypothetical protein [Nitrososphaerota archaeon]